MNNYYYKYNHNDVICVHFKLKLAGYNHKQVAIIHIRHHLKFQIFQQFSLCIR